MTPTKLVTLLPVLALVGVVVCSCQMLAGDRTDLEALRRLKLEKPVFKMAPWCTDFDEARALASAQGKLMLAYFTRSYAG